MPITIHIPEREAWDPVNECFEKIKDQTIVLEHSLLSISKWEAKWKKSYLSSRDKTPEEILDYIKCMTLSKGVDEKAYYSITKDDIIRIQKYIEDPMTATTFKDDRRPPSRKKVTNEEIYYQMVELGIPFSCEKWHLNRLLTLIRVCSVMSQPSRKMNKAQTAKQNASLNALRRRRTGSMG